MIMAINAIAAALCFYSAVTATEPLKIAVFLVLTIVNASALVLNLMG